MKFFNLSRILPYFFVVGLLFLILWNIGYDNSTTLDSTTLDNSTSSLTPHSNNSNSKNVILADFKGCYQIEISQANINQTHWYVHIPIISQNQCPVIIHNVWSIPNNIVHSYRINSQNFSDENYLLEVNFTQIPEIGIYKIYWEISVFILYDTTIILPAYISKVNSSELPTEFLPLLLSSDFIQSNHPEIQEKAELFADIETNVMNIVSDVIQYTANHIDYGVDPSNYSQDALSSLRREQAVCTGKANLAAALLRACDIPTRVLMIYPTHYIIECYLHPYGWVRFEPSIGTPITGPLLIPTNSFESMYLYVSAFCASHIDESSSNDINGFSPIPDGVIAYWAPSDEDFNLSIDVINDWEITCYSLNDLEDSIGYTFNITREIWEYIILYNENLTWSDILNRFPSSFYLLNRAYSFLKLGNTQYSTFLLEQVLCKFKNSDDQYTCISTMIIQFDGISFIFLIASLSGIVFFIRVKKLDR